MEESIVGERRLIEREKGITAFDLKCIALLSMLIDHLGAFIFKDVVWLRCVGRLAFPIFAFLIVEGYLRTKNVGKYMLRLLIFAFISEIPYDLVSKGKLFYIDKQNVMFTLLFGLICIWAIDRFRFKWQSPLIVLTVGVISYFIKCDYGVGGVFTVLVFYIFYNTLTVKYAFIAAVNVFVYDTWIQHVGALAIIPIHFYNGKKGPSAKWLFYIFYPAHLLIIYLICHFLI